MIALARPLARRLASVITSTMLCFALPVAAGDLYSKSSEALAAGDAETALGLLEQALEGAPNDLRLGAEYRQAAIAAEAYDRAITFFEGLVEAHPEAPNALLNFGFANVDKVPVEGAITQVILANKALGYFSRALELEETWLGLYTRGNSYLFWPAIFGRAPKAIADLEKAVALAEAEPEPPAYMARAWAALGDGYWRLDDLEKARTVWRDGLARFPAHPDLEARLSLDGAALDDFLAAKFDTGTRVATDLREIWSAP